MDIRNISVLSFIYNVGLMEVVEFVIYYVWLGAVVDFVIYYVWLGEMVDFVIYFVGLMAMVEPNCHHKLSLRLNKQTTFRSSMRWSLS